MTFTCDSPAPAKRKEIECYTCGKKPFKDMRELRLHWAEIHNAGPRIVSSKDRPKNRGSHACGFPGCGRSFKYDHGQQKHRKDAHGIES